MAKSIIQEDRTHCFICGMNASLEPLDEHHVFFGANRKNSEKYGLKVYIHHNKCHIFGKDSVHKNAEVDRVLKSIVQKRAMRHYGWSVEDFRKIFGRNYIE
jgi:hypothetical protein